MRTLFIFVMAVIGFSCSHKLTESKFFGKTFDTSNAISVNMLAEKMRGQQRSDAVVSGLITESCQNEGCWINIKNASGDDLFIDWDHEFNLPKDISGNRVIANGYAYYDTTKAGQPLSFKASGIFLLKKI